MDEAKPYSSSCKAAYSSPRRAATQLNYSPPRMPHSPFSVQRPLIACDSSIRLSQNKNPLERGFRCIGETGFEPATARPPAGCATRLRHSPWWVGFYGASMQSGRRGSNPFFQLGRLTCNR